MQEAEQLRFQSSLQEQVIDYSPIFEEPIYVRLVQPSPRTLDVPEVVLMNEPIGPLITDSLPPVDNYIEANIPVCETQVENILSDNEVIPEDQPQMESSSLTNALIPEFPVIATSCVKPDSISTDSSTSDSSTVWAGKIIPKKTRLF